MRYTSRRTRLYSFRADSTADDWRPDIVNLLLAKYHGVLHYATVDFENPITIEEMAWWVVPDLKAIKRSKGRPRIRPKKYPLSEEYKNKVAAVRKERRSSMIARYKAGETLEQIGASYGVSRERVRQVIKTEGITGSDGGAVIRSFLKTEERIAKKKEAIEKREQKMQKRWGISFDEWQQIKLSSKKDPFYAYRNQKKSAARRKIEWCFTFREWWKVWQDSDLWEKRGRGKGYCMARFGDSGPYSKDNVYICTIGQNFSDSYLTKPFRSQTNLRRPPLATHCKRGHEMSGENLYIIPKSKQRVCKECSKIRKHAYYMRKRNGA